MKARKMIIAVFALTLAVQMTGCKNDMDTNKPIVIDVSVSDSDVASKAELNWTELGKLTDYEEMRTAVDTIFGNEIVDGVKYGAFYLDPSGTQCTNNTLKVVLGNRYVAEMFATGGNVDIEKIDSSNLGAIEITEETDEEASSAMEDSINSSLDAIYTDLSDSDRTAAMFNAYFNLLPDSTPNYFNGGDTLSRAEAMALVTRATTPVKSLPAVDGFEDAVTGTDYDQYINYAAQQNANSYINTQDKSLTADNFKGAMSRAEFVYLVMNEVYGAENVQGFDTASASLKDCTNAGDLSAELKITGADRCNAYTLSHSLQNVDKGVTEELYKSLVMAAEKGIITPETRWNEGIIKAEAIEIVVNAFNQYYEDNGYLVNNGSKGSTQVLEAQAEELWNKQDANDMNCTKEQFIADYIKEISGGMTPEEFEEGIEGSYSIAFAEELAEKEKEDYLNQIWEENKDNLTCDKDTFVKEYEDFTKDLKPEEISEREFIDHVTDEYGKPEETTPAKENNSNNNENSGNTNNGDSGSSSNGGNSNGGSSNNGGGSSSNNNGGGSSNNNGGGNNDTPVYNPPVDNGNTDSGNGGGFSNNDTGSGNSGGGNGEGFVDIPDGYDWNWDDTWNVVD